MLNLYRIYEQIDWMCFEPITTNDYVIELYFSLESDYISYIRFHYYNKR